MVYRARPGLFYINSGVLCIIRPVEPNYIYVLVHEENNNGSSAGYLLQYGGERKIYQRR